MGYLTNISLTLKQKSQPTLFAWETAAVIEDFSIAYYKDQLKDEVLHQLSRGVNPENIVLFSKSLGVFDDKVFYPVEMNNKKLFRLYELGDFIPLFPSKKVFDLNFVFKLIRDVNDYLYLKRLKSQINHHTIYTYYLEFLKKGPIGVSEMVFSSVRRIVHGPDKYFHTKRVGSIIEKSLDHYNKYIQNEKEIERIKSSLLVDKNTSDRIFDSYFDNFFEFFLKLKRPVIAIIEKNTASFLCSDHISKELRSESTLVLKRVIQVNPTDLTFEADFGLFKFGIKHSVLNHHEREDHELNMALKREALELMKAKKEYYLSLSREQSIDAEVIENEFKQIANNIAKDLDAYDHKHSSIAEYQKNENYFSNSFVYLSSELDKRMKKNLRNEEMDIEIDVLAKLDIRV